MNALKETRQELSGIGREDELYERRFTATQNQAKEKLWKTLCRDFFQQFVGDGKAVVDVGAGDGVFIRHIQARDKYAVDISEHVEQLASAGVTVLRCSATEFDKALETKVDVVFMSNFLEHLTHKSLVLEVLEASYRSLNDGGKIIVLQPNIRYVGSSYWDYIDHHIALTEHSLTEALDITGFSVETLIPRFLPYTVKSKLGKCSGLIGLYLKLPFVWRFFGQQTFVVASKKR